MWEQHKLETTLHGRLVKELGENEGRKFFTNYSVARDYLVDNIYDQIKGTEPDLTDHSSKHIHNVLSNIMRLYGEDINQISAVELYCLMIMVLFHDVGNISGREGHNKNISMVYNHARKHDSTFNQERRIIIQAAKAHCGKTRSGSRDTLSEVLDTEHLNGNEVKLQELAGVLRLADELEEGPQRTSQFMLDKSLISEGSMIYHRYASITKIFIDKGNKRIVLTYDIDINKSDVEDPTSLNQLMNVVYSRINKLDEERRYCKHYSPILNDFKSTEISINFTYEGDEVDGLGPYQYTCIDKFPVPGENEISIVGVHDVSGTAFSIDQLMEKIKELLYENC